MGARAHLNLVMSLLLWINLHASCLYQVEEQKVWTICHLAGWGQLSPLLHSLDGYIDARVAMCAGLPAF